MKDAKVFVDALRKIGIAAGVGEDWYEIGDPEKNDAGTVRTPIYAKTDEIAEKVEQVFDKFFEGTKQ